MYMQLEMMVKSRNVKERLDGDQLLDENAALSESALSSVQRSQEALAGEARPCTSQTRRDPVMHDLAPAGPETQDLEGSSGPVLVPSQPSTKETRMSSVHSPGGSKQPTAYNATAAEAQTSCLADAELKLPGASENLLPKDREVS